MFSFSQDERNTNRVQLNEPSRLIGFRHNPYVGTFHRINYIPFNSEAFSRSVMLDSKKNPLVGHIRHSPSIVSKPRLGLKHHLGIIDESTVFSPGRSPVLSRINFRGKNASNSSSKNFVTSIRQMSHSVFSESSNTSQPADLPTCAICMEVYQNGDSLLTLGCSHCFHSECVSKWFYQDCLNSAEMTSSFSCPSCRRQNYNLDNDGSTLVDEGIAPKFGPGVEDEGYDLVNDLSVSDGSSNHGGKANNNHNNNNSQLGSSKYSDCGFPLC